MSNENNSDNSEKQYNPTVTAFFDEPSFGADATDSTPAELVVKGVTRGGKQYTKILGTGFTSAALDKAGFEQVQKHLQIGSRMAFKLSKKLNSKGGRTFFLEILNDMPSNNNYKPNRNSDDSGI